MRQIPHGPRPGTAPPRTGSARDLAVGVFVLALFALAAGGPISCGGGGGSGAGGHDDAIHELDPGAAAKLIKDRGSRPDFVVLDVRTAGEYQAERIEGAVNIDFRGSDFRQKIASLDREKSYLVYCRTGNRSGQSLGLFRELGFRDVHHLSRGITGWKQQGLPVVSGVPVGQH